jgi:hypothetical protein
MRGICAGASSVGGFARAAPASVRDEAHPSVEVADELVDAIGQREGASQ